MDTLQSVLVLTAPYALMTICGALLWKRRRTFESVLITVGSAVVLISQIVDIHFRSEGSTLTLGGKDSTLVIGQVHAAPAFVHDAFILGLWAAGIGFVIHAVRRG